MSRKDIMIQIELYVQACIDWSQMFLKHPISGLAFDLGAKADEEQKNLCKIIDEELYKIELALNDKLYQNKFGMLTIKVDPLRESKPITLIDSRGRIGDYEVNNISEVIANALRICE